MEPRKKLSDILRNGNAGNNGNDWINEKWEDIPPAPDFGTPVPRGWYITHVIDGELFNAGTGTPGFKVSFEIIEGEHAGRRLWYDIWLTGAAKRAAVRDFAKLGIRDKEQLEKPIPRKQIRCKVLAVVRKDDGGLERNAVKSFDVIGIDPPETDPFAPPDAVGNEPPGNPAGKAAGEKDEPFPFGANKTGDSGPYREGF
jgi:hypothetical protein